MRPFPAMLLPVTLVLAAAPLAARDSLGVFGQWGAFRDPQVPRCYAIAAMEPGRGAAAQGSAQGPTQGYATVSNWPQRQVRGQVHFRLSRPLRQGERPRLVINGQRFELTGAGSEAWASDRGGDARIVAAMRSAGGMQVSARDPQGRNFTDRYSLDGAATAIDAATVGCATRR